MERRKAERQGDEARIRTMREGRGRISEANEVHADGSKKPQDTIAAHADYRVSRRAATKLSLRGTDEPTIWRPGGAAFIRAARHWDRVHHAGGIQGADGGERVGRQRPTGDCGAFKGERTHCVRRTTTTTFLTKSTTLQ